MGMSDTIAWMKNIFAKNQNNVFLIDSITGKQYTYYEIEQLSLRGASLLQKKGIIKGDRINILLPNCLEFVLLYFSCMHLGAIPVPINIKLHIKDIEYILKHAQPQLIFADNSFRESILKEWLPSNSEIIFFQTSSVQTSSASKESILLQEMSILEPFDNYPFSSINKDDTILIIYTSGTTSQPKGVEFSYDKMISNALAFIKTTNLDSSYRFYDILPLAYMAGFYNLLLVPFLCGGSVVLEKVFDFSVALSFWKKIEQYQINALWLVPSIISILLSVNNKKMINDKIRLQIKVIFSGTAPLSSSLIASFEKAFSLKLYNTYGLSELLFISANYPNLIELKGVGKVLPGCNVSIIDDEGKTVPVGTVGEIVINSDYLMKGYYLSPEQTASALSNGIFKTGDVGYIDAEKFLYITDRKKDLIIRGGINISPAEIEEVLMKYPKVKEAAVVGIADELQGEQIVAVVQLFEHKITESNIKTELLNHCGKLLAPFKLPENIFLVEQFPKSVTGKVQKNKLKELFSSSQLK